MEKLLLWLILRLDKLRRNVEFQNKKFFKNRKKKYLFSERKKNMNMKVWQGLEDYRGGGDRYFLRFRCEKKRRLSEDYGC